MLHIKALFAAIVATAAATGADAQNVTAWRSPECGCCERWAQSLEAAGMHVAMHDAADMAAVKKTHGVPQKVASCHTAKVDGYTIEGHVPAREIRRLLDERPVAVGLSAPGMPLGSPGMEGGAREPYQVLLIKKDGTTQVFAAYP
ncbi:Uncharacterized conserved protein [Rhodoblastus acidophilus]|uniref:Uncharacterized conserved protein n=1 Tax=Rhodoblastus acidophilus TaxID=1074 RepID=A0A212S8S3_RHOAC|nr:DUF411 domain-containing protein [Rhodoblastus acidophilus]PPQ36839.1 hypothetical protein CKO16_16635 [Rhodoblastus acidophilus]RAI21425.1 hypothetical protein CH337_07795 [Rhodoblastus acidophilus]SNB81743.1 Uncharacterized conserved protein [Rhodoblastus acidophilus]